MPAGLDAFSWFSVSRRGIETDTERCSGNYNATGSLHQPVAFSGERGMLRGRQDGRFVRLAGSAGGQLGRRREFAREHVVIRYFRARPARGIIVCLGLLALCLVSGCYERVAQGNQATYRFAWWLGPAGIAGDILSVAVGWFVRSWNKRWGFGLMCLGPVLLVMVILPMYSDRVLIDDEHFEAKYGLWFSPTQQNIRFQDLLEIRYVGVPGNRGRMNYKLRCMNREGQVIVVPAGDLVRQTVPEILERARGRGIAVVTEVQ